jgi:hypothetical protein
MIGGDKTVANSVVQINQRLFSLSKKYIGFIEPKIHRHDPCSRLKVSQHFGGICFLHIQGIRISQERNRHEILRVCAYTLQFHYVCTFRSPQTTFLLEILLKRILEISNPQQELLTKAICSALHHCTVVFCCVTLKCSQVFIIASQENCLPIPWTKAPLLIKYSSSILYIYLPALVTKLFQLSGWVCYSSVSNGLGPEWTGRVTEKKSKEL